MENGKPKACMGILLSECGNSGDYTCKGLSESKFCCPTRTDNNGMFSFVTKKCTTDLLFNEILFIQKKVLYIEKRLAHTTVLSLATTMETPLSQM